MPRNLIVYVELSFLAHATEDSDKVLKAAQNLFPIDCLGQISFNKNTLKGEYGNPITLYKTQIENTEMAEALLRNISSNLSTLDKETMLLELKMRIKKGNLFLRLDKQAAFMGKHKLGRTDPIRLRIRFKTSRIEDIEETCRKIGMLP